MRPEVRLLVCEPLYEEARAALPAESMPELAIELMARPCETPNHTKAALLDAAARTVPLAGGASVLFGGGCLAGLKPDAAQHSRLHVISEDTCFGFLIDDVEIGRLLDSRAFLLTPGWVARWPLRMKNLGITAELAPLIFAESANRLVLLDTGTVPDVMTHLEALSRFVGLPFERIAVGLDRMRAKLLSAAWKARNAELTDLREQLAQARRRAAEANAIAELSKRAAGMLDEPKIAWTLMSIARDLTAAERAMWIPIHHGHAGEPVTLPALAIDEGVVASFLDAAPVPTRTAAGDLTLRVTGVDGDLGVLVLSDLPFPEQGDRYLGLLGPLAQAVQPMLGNARSMHGLIRLCAWCRKVGEPDGRWRGLEEYVHDHTKAMFTHGICPTCAAEMEASATTDL